MEPDHLNPHGYAYHPGLSTSVAAWLQDQEASDEPHDDGGHDCHDGHDGHDSPLLRPAYAPADHDVVLLQHQPARPDMAIPTRQRQATSNGARPPPKSAPRAASSSKAAAAAATSPAAPAASGIPRASPQTANKVRALAERFEQSPARSPPVTSPAARSRSREPARAASHELGKRANASQTSPASAARPSKEASYGSYRFNNLKPRERPQPAPATPRTSRRTNGSRGSIDPPVSPAQKTVTTPSRQPAPSARQPFFGEVVNQDITSPGFGIDHSLEPLADGPRQSAASFESQRSTGHAMSADDAHPEQPSEQLTSRSAKQTSPPSRIPIAARRPSVSSDSNSSTRSIKHTPARVNYRGKLPSPTPLNKKKPATVGSAKANATDQSTLPALAYRGYRERGKSPLDARGGTSVPAVVTAPLAPTSPRLRNSRERQALQASPKARSKPLDSPGEPLHSPLRRSFESQQDEAFNHDEIATGPSIPKTEPAHRPMHARKRSDRLPHDENPNPLSNQLQGLSLQTSRLPPKQAASVLTDFEESPILGLPGSFIVTPPTAQEELEPPFLPSTVFRPQSRDHAPSSPDIDQSELGVRESIPIMLSEEEPTNRWEPTFEDMDEALSFSFQPDRIYGDIDGQPLSRYHLDDSPTDPFPNRETLRPDDSASIAPYQSLGTLAFNSETYSVVNSVLNMYHQSPVISAELAVISRDRVQQVSPVIAQHKDWGSKEATETYLARLLSDANGSADQAEIEKPSKQTPPSNTSLSVPGLDHDSFEPEVGGTAIIYPPESRRYSRGSRGSAATTIQDDASRSGSSFGNPSQDSLLQASTEHTSTTTNGVELPQLAWTNSGLGLSLHGAIPQPPASPAPPRPAHSPPPPPVKPSIEEQLTPIDGPDVSFDDHYSMHPARSHSPVIQIYEQSLEDRYGTSLESESQGSAESERIERDQPDAAKQILIKRYRILEELLTTEHQFCIDMMIAHNIFEATAQNLMSEKEKKMLFSNCKELEKFSLSLFRSFKKAAKPVVNYEIPPPTGPWNRELSETKPSNGFDSALDLPRPSEDSQNQFETCTPENDRQISIGQVFLENREKMERLYTTYFLNQDNAAAYIKKNQNNPELSSWVTACFEQVENMTQAWDLDSLLLKPCQRLLKYPLLLEGLISSSEPDHPDLQNLKDAKAELLEINVRINEAKARADTFRAATSEGKKEKGRGKGIGKTFVKAFIPKVDKSKAYDEADRAFKDPEYKSREQKFGGHFFQLQIVMRDFEQYLESITDHYMQLNIVFLGFITVCEVAPSIYPEIESTWRKWAMAHFELQNKALEEHKAAVRTRVLKPVGDLWEMWVSYQKTIEQRKKFLLYYVKYKHAIDRGEKVDPDLEESGKKFTTINDTLKHELPLLYERTKGLMRTLMTLFMCLQKDWYKTCSKKILPLLESEPQHTTSLRYDLESYVERFNSDHKPMQDLANRLGIINRTLLIDVSNMTSPVPTISSNDGSSRNSSSRRTESISSDASTLVSTLDSRNRNSGGLGSRPHIRPVDNPPRSSPAGPAYPSLYQGGQPGRAGLGPTSLREARALSPVPDNNEGMIMQNDRRAPGSSRNRNHLRIDGAINSSERSPVGTGAFDFPPQLGASFLSPTMPPPLIHSNSAPGPQTISQASQQQQRASHVFTSALPMSDSPMRRSVEDLPTTPGETDDPEVLFLAASLFEFNIAHDRREGGIPYLVYVPGEIFDVIGMKGELWLARNQDDPTKTVGWIWEKHFARILPEDA